MIKNLNHPVAILLTQEMLLSGCTTTLKHCLKSYSFNTNSSYDISTFHQALITLVMPGTN